ncbi:hypothetical protein TSMEX_010406 [Taenia solium]|eukprot:TsM_001053200 transcript=TsM_001053200 gene=TsM_001053200
MSYSRQKKYYGKHSQPNTYHEGDLVQIYRPIPPPGMHRKFYHLWNRDPFRVVKVLSPTNYHIRNAELRTQPITDNHNKIRPYKAAPPVGQRRKDNFDMAADARGSSQGSEAPTS